MDSERQGSWQSLGVVKTIANERDEGIRGREIQATLEIEE